MSEDQDQKPTDAQNQAPEKVANVTFDDGTEEVTESPAPAEPKAEEAETPESTEPKIKEEETPPEKEKIEPERPINQEAVQKKINKAIWEKKEEQRKREEVEAQLAEVQQRLAALDQQMVHVPELPDPFDPDFDAKVRVRDEALKKQAQLEAQKSINEMMQEKARKEKAQAENEKIKGYVNQMYASADAHGIKKEDLQQADTTVAMFVKDPGLASFIISQKTAPLIVNHLASNIAELEKISQMSPITAAAYIVTDIIPAAERFKPKKSAAPEPLDLPSGKAGVKKNPFLEGVIFE